MRRLPTPPEFRPLTPARAPNGAGGSGGGVYGSAPPPDPTSIPSPEETDNWTPPAEISAIARLDRDLRAAAKTLTEYEAAYMVDMYYALQEQRIRAAAQVRASTDQEEPNALLRWNMSNYWTLEGDVKRAMQAYAESKPLGQWLLSVMGIGPVLAAGFMAHINVERSTSVSHLWSFAGYNPEVVWLGAAAALTFVYEKLGYAPEARRSAGKEALTPQQIETVARAAGRSAESLTHMASRDGQEKITPQRLATALAKRPWNASLKVLGWKAGQSFVKSSTREGSFYGPRYRTAKFYYLQQNNMAFDEATGRYTRADANAVSAYREQAEEVLRTRNIGKETDAYAWYSQGMLPPAHIQARAERKTVKLFLSHAWHVAYELQYKRRPPEPWIIAEGHHADLIPPPGWEQMKRELGIEVA